MKSPSIMVEVVYAPPAKPMRRRLKLPVGSTVGEAIRGCGLLAICIEIDPSRIRVGIFGRVVQFDRPLRDGDRVEIYRALIADPKEVRRRRAACGAGWART